MSEKVSARGDTGSPQFACPGHVSGEWDPAACPRILRFGRPARSVARRLPSESSGVYLRLTNRRWSAFASTIGLSVDVASRKLSGNVSAVSTSGCERARAHGRERLVATTLPGVRRRIALPNYVGRVRWRPRDSRHLWRQPLDLRRMQCRRHGLAMPALQPQVGVTP